jgi:uncharacterized protein (TIGR02466 family)
MILSHSSRDLLCDLVGRHSLACGNPTLSLKKHLEGRNRIPGMALHQNLSNGMLLAWPTPILTRRIQDADLLSDLRRVILDREQAYPDGIDRALVNGWHSDTDLMKWPDPSIETLKSIISAGLADFIKQLNNDKGFSGKAQVTAWANVSRRGGFHRLHTHHSSMVSGVFYVDTGTPDPDDTHFNGTISFLDPRLAVEMIPLPGSPFGEKLKVEPDPGLMLMFPSWLQHFVDPFRGEGTRISIAFNIGLYGGDSAA